MQSTLTDDEIEGLLGEPQGEWGIRTFKDPSFLYPRHQNDMTKFIETEYIPISPTTHLVEDDYLSEWGGLLLMDHQIRFLNHVFTPCNNRLPYETIIYSDLKKSGKTALEASVIAGWCRIFGGEVFCLANARSQAGDRAFARFMNYVGHLEREDPDLFAAWITRNDVEWVETKDPYSSVKFLPVSPGSVAGAFQSLTAWDEIWNFDRDTALRLYSEMQPIPTIPNRTLPEWSVTPGYVVESPSVRFIATYVGYFGESRLCWELYLQTVNEDTDTGKAQGNRVAGLEDLPVFVSDDGRTIAYWNQDTPRMPWQTKEFISRAKSDPINKLVPEEFKRLWQNRWTTGAEGYIDMNTIRKMMAEGDAIGLENLYP